MRRLISLSIAAATAVSLAAIPTVQAASAAPSPKAASAAARPVAAALHVDKARLAAAFRDAAPPKSHTPHLDATVSSLPVAKDGTVQVTVAGGQKAVAAAIKARGDKALTFYGGQTSAVISKRELTTLAESAGVTLVKPSTLAYDMTAGPTQAVANSLSGAQSWITGNGGAGVKIAVVDLGFQNLSAEVTAGHLVADPIIDTGCLDENATQHGTAVAEIVHQMAPAAEIVPICVATNLGFNTAVNDILSENALDPTHPFKIATSSLGFPNDSRGDGSDPAASGDPSTDGAVARARKAGVLWIQSAGNEAEDHWGGNLADANHDNVIDLHGTFPQVPDDDVVFLPSGGSGAITMQYDQWPRTKGGLALDVLPEQCETVDCTSPNDPVKFGHIRESTPNGLPTMEVDIQNTSAFGQFYDIEVHVTDTFPVGARYDLTYYGDVSDSLNACSNLTGTTCDNTPRAEMQSISAPANSPFALAVGAHDVHAGLSTSIEGFSSQGPTIDGRVKPDITGWDGTASWLPDFNVSTDFPGFYGTSAAAPHVAGAAALVLAQNPTWDASQLENFLEQRADLGSPSNPPTNTRGYGLLTMGAPPGALPSGGQYHALASPVRVLDTRTTTGGHHARLAGAGEATVNLATGPGVLPDGTTAVAINLTGVNASNTTFLSVFPGGTAWPKTSNLNLTASDRTAAVFAIVSVNALKSIIVRNNAGLVDAVIDEVGYFTSTPQTGGLYTPLSTSRRVLDTRTTNGDHLGKLPSNGTVEVRPAPPTGATAAIVNITTVNSTTSSGFVSAAPTCSKAASTLNFNTNARANLAIVGLDGTGRFCISNNTGAVDVVVDVLGFMGTSGATYVGLPAPQRIMDTRTGNGPVPVRPITSAHPDVVVGSGLGAVPAAASALLTGVTEASATATGFVQAYAGTTRPTGPASTLNMSPGRIVPNAAVIGLDGKQFSIYANLGNTAVAVDLFGYFLPLS